MTHLNKRELRDIPNQDGYEFVGVTHDGDEIKCIVKKNPIGCHGAYDLDGNPVFIQLKYWVKVLGKGV